MPKRNSILVPVVLVSVLWAVGIGEHSTRHVDAASALDAGVGLLPVVGVAASESFEDYDNNRIDNADDGDGVPDERSTPPPGNDDCHIAEDPPNPDRPPTGAFTICTGDPAHPELGDWQYYSGDRTGYCENDDTITCVNKAHCAAVGGVCINDLLGICEKWPGYPETPPDFGQVCNPLDQTSCTDPPNEPIGANSCFPWGYGPIGFFKPAYECYVETDNQTASTDGPTAAGDCLGSGEDSFRGDVWYTVTAPCTGKAIIDMCTAASEYNSMLAVFGDHTGTPKCPSTGDDNLDLLYCNDDYCMGDETVSAVSWATEADAVYILRLGGYSATGTDADAAQGLSRFHVGFYCAQHPPPLFYAPLPAGTRTCTTDRDCDIAAVNQLALPGTCNTGICYAGKSRYLSIDPRTNLTADSVIKVEVGEMRRCQNAPTRACMINSDCDDVCDDVAGDPPYHMWKCPPYDCSALVPPAPCIWSGPCVDLAPTFDPPLAWIVQQPMQDPTGGAARSPVVLLTPTPPPRKTAVKTTTGWPISAERFLSLPAVILPGRMYGRTCPPESFTSPAARSSRLPLMPSMRVLRTISTSVVRR